MRVSGSSGKLWHLVFEDSDLPSLVGNLLALKIVAPNLLQLLNPTPLVLDFTHVTGDTQGDKVALLLTVLESLYLEKRVEIIAGPGLLETFEFFNTDGNFKIYKNLEDRAATQES